MKFFIPSALTKKHQDALRTYLSRNPQYDTLVWEMIYEAIDLLAQAQVITDQVPQTFKQVYTEHVERPFADQYIAQLLSSKDVAKDSPGVTALFARQIMPTLQKANLLGKEWPQSWLLLTYCVYWWQSFAKGYGFEVEIMRDLSRSGIDFHMHDIQNQFERYSPADLTVLGLWGDIKTSIYFLRRPSEGQLLNDFYITRLYEQGRQRTLVVFQKPFAWEAIGGGTAVSGTLESILSMLPTPVRLAQRGIMLVVVEYETWKQMVRHQQSKTGVENE
jgi:hypothetical protein